MWPGGRNIWTPVPDLLPELAIRILLLLLVYVMQLTLEPLMFTNITETELQDDFFKRPRRESLVPPWATICIVIVIPMLLLSLPLLLNRNYVDSTQAFLAWTLALSINAVITETMKLVIGRPRPDFFYRCFPNGEIPQGLHCTGDVREVIEGRKSFPSGHSSFSLCSMSFLSFWMCGRLRVFSENRRKCLRVAVCLMPLVPGAIVAASRYYDNHHHWTDVIVGSFIGLITSYLCYSQYYNSLYSDLSGYPYVLTENQLFDITSQIGFC